MSGELVLVVGADTGMQGHLASLLQRWGYTPVPGRSVEEVTDSIERYSREFHREGFTLPPIVMERLLQYRYPDNIRELENFVRCMILLNGPGISKTLGVRIKADEAGRDIPEPAEALPRSLKEIGRAAARAAEREAIAKALEQTGWNRVRAARLLKTSYRALLYKMKEAGLKHGPKPNPRASELRAG